MLVSRHGSELSRLLRISLGLGALVFAAAVVSSAALPSPQDSKKLPISILYGYVFDQNGHLFRYADVRVRRVSDKKPKWQAMSDLQGEFSVHVPAGDDYVVEVKAKGYVTQTQTVTAPAYQRVDLVFHMEPVPGTKK
jgi:Carboxypeptidase regulatory-like domain